MKRPDKKGQILYDSTYMEYLTFWEDGKVLKTVSWGRDNWEIGIDKYILLHIKSITHKDLLYSMRNYSILCNDRYGDRI